MAKYLYLVCLMAITICGNAQTDEQTIKAILEQQRQAWNRGNLDDYMLGYWHSDSLVFIGKAGPTYGYTPTLERYKKSYDDRDKMGQLAFDILQVRRLSVDYYFVLGKWALKRTASLGDLGGSFTLLFRKVKNKWVIVADHSS